MLGDLLSGVAIGDVGLAGIVSVTIFMVLSGKLVPKSVLDNERENSKTWREAHDKQQEINRVQHDTNSELLTLARADHHALTDLQTLGQRMLAQEGQAKD